MKFKSKKNVRQRGATTHGWGSMKKHRGAGHRGGRGNAGTGKRGDAKKPSYWKKKYFGKVGFKKKGIKIDIKPINLRDIEQNITKYVTLKLAEPQSDTFVIDLDKLGFNKLLGAGNVTKKFKITTLYSSASAIEKVSNAGGEVIVKEGK